MVKSTGIVRKVDELGRVVIPNELRRTMEIAEGTPLEIYTDGDNIILKKYAPGCTFCGEIKDNMINHGGKIICPDCIKQLQKQALLDQATSRR